MPFDGVAFQEKPVTGRNEIGPWRVQQKTSGSVSCRYTLRCPRKVKSLPWRKDMIVAADEQQKLGEKTLKHQADEVEEAAEIKNQVQHSNIEQPLY